MAAWSGLIPSSVPNRRLGSTKRVATGWPLSTSHWSSTSAQPWCVGVARSGVKVRREIVHIEVFPDERLYGVDTVVAMCTDAAFARRYMTELYSDLVGVIAERCRDEFARMVGDHQRVPVLVQCAAGQDRTGVLVALLLLALGVPRHVVVEDYTRSVESWDAIRLAGWAEQALGSGQRVPPAGEAVEQLMARPEYIELAIDEVLDRYGTIDRYWEAGGVNAERLDRVRDTLLQ